MSLTPSASRTSALIFLLALFGVLYALSLTLGFTKALLNADRLVSFDYAANAFFGPYRHTTLVEIFLAITTLGMGPPVTMMVFVATGFLWIGNRRDIVRPLWTVFLGMEVTVWVTKFVVDRIRPDFIPGASASSPSFPSGHAAGSIAVYGFLAYVLASSVAAVHVRVAILISAFVLIVLIGFSRIFLSLHFVSDVAAGYLIGLFWLLIGVVSLRLRQES